jgi:hypothetical protein
MSKPTLGNVLFDLERALSNYDEMFLMARTYHEEWMKCAAERDALQEDVGRLVAALQPKGDAARVQDAFEAMGLPPLLEFPSTDGGSK